ncbi:EAL domain-containing protein [Rheinheimera marina]|uniref:EAL domain-containing protein n=1 Tax=Rheinheimera marina TaxID=1774958 RepID=A0ABV9JMI9_9GAMM
MSAWTKFCVCCVWMLSLQVQAYISIQPMVQARDNQHLRAQLFSQDTDGYLWWTTSSQLHQFDGHLQHSVALPPALHHPLTALGQAGADLLWLADKRDLWQFQPSTGQFRELWQADFPILRLWSTAQSRLILTSHSLWSWPAGQQAPTLLWQNPPTAAPWLQASVHQDALWLWNQEGLQQFSLASQSWQRISLPFQGMPLLQAGPDQQLWLLSPQKQLYLWQHSQLQPIAAEQPFAASQLQLDSLGQLWLLQANRLSLYQPDQQQWQHQRLQKNWSGLFADRHQNLWLSDPAGNIALASQSALDAQPDAQLQLPASTLVWQQGVLGNADQQWQAPAEASQAEQAGVQQNNPWFLTSQQLWFKTPEQPQWQVLPQRIRALQPGTAGLWFVDEKGLWLLNVLGQAPELIQQNAGWYFLSLNQHQLWLAGHDQLYLYDLSAQELSRWSAECGMQSCPALSQLIAMRAGDRQLELLLTGSLVNFKPDEQALVLRQQSKLAVPPQTQQFWSKPDQLWLVSQDKLQLFSANTGSNPSWTLNEGEFFTAAPWLSPQGGLRLRTNQASYQVVPGQDSARLPVNPVRLQLIADPGQHLRRHGNELRLDSKGSSSRWQLSHYPTAGKQWQYFRYQLDQEPARLLDYPTQQFVLDLPASGSHQLKLEASYDGIHWQQAAQYQLQLQRYLNLPTIWLGLLLLCSAVTLCFVLWRVRRYQQHLASTNEQQLLIGSLFNNTQDAVWLADQELQIQKVNQAFTQITGYPQGTIEGRVMPLFTAQGHQTELLKSIREQLQQFQFWRGEVWSQKANGDRIAVSLAITLLSPTGAGKDELYLGIFSDVTNRKLNEKELRKLSTRDALTQLPNRSLFLEHLERAISSCNSRFPQFAVILLDLDRFAKINDSLGHQQGNQLLQLVAARLQQQLPAGYILAKTGIDEFAILVPSHFYTEQFDALLNRLANQLLLQIREPLQLAELQVTQTASVGIAVYPADGEASDSLLRSADTALHHAKHMGRNNAQFFNDKMLQRTPEYLALESDLWRGLNQQEFHVLYQPKYNISQNQIVGFEALCRWQNPQRGLVSPAVFIPIAEENGVIIQLDRLVFSQVCAQIRLWQQQGVMRGRVAVNLSVQQLQQKDLPDFLGQQLRLHGVDAQFIELEITETAMMRDAEHCLQMMHQLKALGFTLALDDFGTGYSSLGYLKRFPIDTLKIDRAFVKDMDSSEQDRNITSTIIRLAGYLNIAIVAEGVETEMQAYLLHVMGCEVAQGYLFSAPASPEQVSLLLQKETEKA